MDTPAFVLGPAPDFWADLRITVPGEADPVPIPLRLRPLGRRAMRAWIRSFGEAAVGDETDQGAEDRTVGLLREIIVGWRVCDRVGVAVPLTPASLDEFLNAYPAAAGEISRQYVEIVAASRLGN